MSANVRHNRIAIPIKKSVNVSRAFIIKESAKKCAAQFQCFVLHVQCLSQLLLLLILFLSVLVVVVVSRVRSAVPSQIFLICRDFVAKGRDDLMENRTFVDVERLTVPMP